MPDRAAGITAEKKIIASILNKLARITDTLTQEIRILSWRIDRLEGKTKKKQPRKKARRADNRV